ncbi:MAG: hypothetical protein JWO38_1604 [Gemmataceae bacterium]|nr:hypothetical protein [Gemmataceae bacterium]
MPLVVVSVCVGGLVGYMIHKPEQTARVTHPAFEPLQMQILEPRAEGGVRVVKLRLLRIGERGGAMDDYSTAADAGDTRRWWRITVPGETGDRMYYGPEIAP